ncbi:MAG: type VI secretion system contractile sheath large subunit [Planctomycetes bacterium]|nr:type VI secretion system contractile sheath large subunit [Planctomycetota bacterium]MCW8135873.1 type VI secretion system contractile sheath large subunit [Planctomycetota bacterium]
MTDRVEGFSNDVGFGSSDLPELRDMPFRIMAVGDFCGVNRSAARDPAVIDAHDFDKRLSDFMPRAHFEVENYLGTGKTLEIDFTPASIKDFEPANMAARIPALAPVHDFIRRAKGLRDGTLKSNDFKRDLAAIQSIPALRESLDAVFQAIGGPEGAAPAVGIDDILNASAAPKAAKGSAIDAFAAGLSGAGNQGFDVSGAIDSASRLLAKQLDPVLRHESVRRLERNWRGLHLLCKRGKGARLEVFDGDFDAWQQVVFEHELAGTSDAPLAMVLLADEIPGGSAAIDQLQQWGDAGGQIQCAVVFEAGEGFLNTGVETLAALNAPATHFDQPIFDKWRSLRDKDESRWLVAALNPWFMRPAFTHKRHNADGPVAWGSPVWILGAVVAGSMERTGWPANHTGASSGEVTGLAVYPHSDGAEYPLKALLPDAHFKDLVKAGFTPLVTQANNDAAWVLLAPTVHRPSKAEEEGKLGTLAYQLLAARIGEAVVRAKQRLSVPNDEEATVNNFERYVNALVSNTGTGATAMARVQGGQIQIALRTGRDVLNGVEMQLALGL